MNINAISPDEMLKKVEKLHYSFFRIEQTLASVNANSPLSDALDDLIRNVSESRKTAEGLMEMLEVDREAKEQLDLHIYAGRKELLDTLVGSSNAYHIRCQRILAATDNLPRAVLELSDRLNEEQSTITSLKKKLEYAELHVNEANAKFGKLERKFREVDKVAKAFQAYKQRKKVEWDQEKASLTAELNKMNNDMAAIFAEKEKLLRMSQAQQPDLPATTPAGPSQADMQELENELSQQKATNKELEEEVAELLRKQESLEHEKTVLEEKFTNRGQRLKILRSQKATAEAEKVTAEGELARLQTIEMEHNILKTECERIAISMNSMISKWGNNNTPFISRSAIAPTYSTPNRPAVTASSDLFTPTRSLAASSSVHSPSPTSGSTNAERFVRQSSSSINSRPRNPVAGPWTFKCNDDDVVVQAGEHLVRCHARKNPDPKEDGHDSHMN